MLCLSLVLHFSVTRYGSPKLEFDVKKFFQRLLPPSLRSKNVEIPVVRLSGTIATGGGLRPQLSLASAAPLLEKAFADKSAPCVAISVNSPGGSPVQSRLIFRRIRDLADENKKPVFMFLEDVAASGGYMIAIAGDEIIADPSTIVGSIGVVAATFGFPEMLKKIGIERRVYTAGTNKSTLDPFKPEKKEDVAHLKALQLEVHQTFIDLVKERRGAKLANDPDMFTGLFWTGIKGKELGLVDHLGDMRSFLKAKYGEKTKLKLIAQSRGLFGLRQGGTPGVTSAERAAIAATDNLAGFLEERALWSRYGL
jgi:signal peptide peptidase SppA